MSSHQDDVAVVATQRDSTNSPESFATSPSDSSSSLNQYNSLTPTSNVSSSSSTAFSSSSSSASSAGLSPANLVSTNVASKASSRSLAVTPLTALRGSVNKGESFNNGGKFASHNYRDLQRQLSITPTMHSSGACQMSHSYTLHSLEPRPLKPFKTRSAYIEAMKEDLAEWLNRLYPDLELNPDNLFGQLETGAIICRHANNVTQMGRTFMLEQQSSNTDDSAGGGSSNDNSLTHDNGHRGTTLGSPVSPESESHYHNSLDHGHQLLSYRHRNSATNSSISSIATSSSSASRQRLSLTGSSVLSPLREHQTIDWFRVKMISYKPDARAGTFFARDNICQFILWCRSLHVRECLLFETDDLVGRKNEKSFILCLLEVARIGFKVGMPTPLIIQLEQEIDREIENEAKLQRLLNGEHAKKPDSDLDNEVTSSSPLERKSNEDDTNNNHQEIQAKVAQESETLEALKANEVKKDEDEDEEEEEQEQDFGPKPQVITNDLLSLHEKVVQLLCQCTCPTQFPMVRIGDGKYKVGDKLIIFVRILRRHIMVRVGGGWQELSEFLRQKDPCRTKHNLSTFNNHHQQSMEHVSSALNSMIATSNTGPNTTTTTATIQATRIPTLINGTNNSRSRLLASNCHLNKEYNSHRRTSAGQKLISGSVSMSWLAHNS